MALEMFVAGAGGLSLLEGANLAFPQGGGHLVVAPYRTPGGAGDSTGSSGGGFTAPSAGMSSSQAAANMAEQDYAARSNAAGQAAQDQAIRDASIAAARARQASSGPLVADETPRRQPTALGG
jgi:hypothetical protein